MRRRNENDFGRGTFGLFADNDALLVDRPRNQSRAGESKHAARLMESGIFDPGDFATVNERERADHQRLLRSGGDDDLVVMATRAAEVTQISSDGFAKIDISAARRVLQQVRAFFSENLRSQAFPDLDWKFIQCGERPEL